MVTSLKARCVSRWRLMRDSASCGREATEYDSFSRSRARISSLVSCLYESGGKGMGENLRDSSQCTIVIVVLPLLFRLEPQPREAPEILLGDRLVDSGPTSNAFAIVVRYVGPPVRLGLDVSEDHVLNRSRHARHFPRNVCLPAAPCLGEVLQNGARLVRLHALGHHVKNVVHDSRAQLKVIVGFHALLGDSLRKSFGRAAFELARKEVTKPALQERHNAAQEEKPDAPARRPDATARPLAYGARVEAVVDQRYL
eukprot:scaffold29471_cov28-Tisochrysis_lutea.AAC.6